MARRRRYSTTDRWNIARILTLIGAILTLVGYGFSLFNSIMNFIVEGIIISLVCIIIAIFVLIQVRIVDSFRITVPFNWWMLLILVCLQAFLANFAVPFAGMVTASNLGGFIGLGLLFEVIAVIILLIDAL